jgi:hypothetical protein
MAETISSEYPNLIRFALGGSDIVTEVNIPSWARKVSVQFISNSGKISFFETDGASISTQYISVAADSWFEMNWAIGSSRNTGRTSIFLASATATTTVEIIVEG